MIDLHYHILAGVDDGAASDEESCMMAQIAVDSGVTMVAATPHCNLRGYFDNYLTQALRDRFLHLDRLLKEQEIPLGLRAGMEIYMTPEVPRLLREKRLLTLGGSRYLLVEFDFDGSFPWACRMLRAVAEQEVVPVVAHPERYRFIQEEPERLFDWLEAGYVLQLNKGSFFGRFGRGAARTAHWCLRQGCAHAVGSDAHSPYQRTTRLSDIHAYLSEIASVAAADALLRDNPARILKNRPVRPVRPDSGSGEDIG